MKRIRTGDEVIVITGKDKGKRGKVVSFAEGERCIVEGINLASKHVKPNPNKNERGGVLPKEVPIHLSNVMLYNAATGKGDRVGFKEVNDKKVRYFKSNDQVIEG